MWMADVIAIVADGIATYYWLADGIIVWQLE